MQEKKISFDGIHQKTGYVVSAQIEEQEEHLNEEQKDDEQEQDVKDAAKERRHRDMLMKVDYYIGRCKSLYRTLSHSTQCMYDDMLDGMRLEAVQAVEGRKQGEIVRMVAENVDLLRQTISFVQHEYQRFSDGLRDARKPDLPFLSDDEVAAWWRWYDDPNLVQWQRDTWIREEFAAQCSRWKSIALHRKKVLSLADESGIFPSRVPALGRIADTDVFLRIEEDDRREAIARAEAAVLACASGRENEYRNYEEGLYKASHGPNRILHPADMGTLLKDVFSTGNPHARYTSLVVPVLALRSSLRERFDSVERRIQKEGIPETLEPEQLAMFLRWPTQKCAVYLTEVHLRLDEQCDRLQRMDVTKRVFQRTTYTIRQAMDMRDWVGAEVSLEKARLEHPQDVELMHLYTYLQEHRNDQEKKDRLKPELHVLLQHVHHLSVHIPDVLRPLYAAALPKGESAFKKLAGAMFKGVMHERRAQEREIQAFTCSSNEAPVMCVTNNGEVQQHVNDVLLEAQDNDPRLPALHIEDADVRPAMRESLVFEVNVWILDALRRLKDAGLSCTLHGEAVPLAA